MRILFISSSFPPETDMQTTRNIYLVKALLEHGHQVDIITCGEKTKSSELFDTVLDKTNIYRTKHPLIYRWHKFINQNVKNNFIKKIHNISVNYYARPDLYAGWDDLVCKEMNSNNLFDYDVVISSSGSFTAHIAANKWKRKTNRKWVAEYGDPWGLNSFGEINERYYKQEESIMKDCDGFVFTTQATIDAYKRNYRNQKQYALVPCGFGDIIEDIEHEKKEVVFTYTGTAYKRDRNLAPFIESVCKRTDVKALFVGSISGDIQQAYQSYDNVIFKGRVPYDESLQLIGKTDVLVHIGNFGTMQVPGKTYIYLSSKKPILYVQQQEENDPTLAVIEKFKAVITCKNTFEDISKSIDTLIKDFSKLKKDAKERINSEELQQFSWAQLGLKFEQFVKSIVEQQ